MEKLDQCKRKGASTVNS